MCDEPIKLLILGNGFDLAHKLPTRYSDFLEFCERIELMFKPSYTGNYKKDYIDNWEAPQKIKTEALQTYEQSKNGENYNKIFKKIYDILRENIWYYYFYEIYKKNIYKGENWIDFESEISHIIELIDKSTNNLSDSIIDIKQVLDVNNTKKPTKISLIFDLLNKPKKNSQTIKNIRDLRKRFFDDLEKFTIVLEIYLSHFVEKLEIDIISDDIKIINPDYIINFNYTNTYERLYNSKDIFYIHGKCYENRIAEDNNMVLGIDEYWSEPECDKHTNFAIFKKFVQRIRKKTGIKHYEYSNEIKNANLITNLDDISNKPQIYIFGHSLDITDKDILLEFLNNETAKVTIYCVDKETEGELIANTIKIIGEKSLLDKVNRIEPQIEFKIQKEMTSKS